MVREILTVTQVRSVWEIRIGLEIRQRHLYTEVRHGQGIIQKKRLIAPTDELQSLTAH
jgi:hypothetical protein